MILIFSKNLLEVTTEMVIEWINYFGFDFCRINGDEIYDMDYLFYKIASNDNKLVVSNSISININDVSVIWYRRWTNRKYLNIYKNTEREKEILPFEFIENINSDNLSIRTFLISKFDGIPIISSPDNLRNVSKFKVLEYAQKLGLLIPETIICNNKNELNLFFDKHKRIITKDIENTGTIVIDNINYSNYTKRITQKELENVPMKFALSVFQEEIDKEFEIRSFYFFGKFYSMAIFSQSDKMTEVDFRNYNTKKPNRNVPFILPKTLSNLLKKLMKKLKLETGSIDLIKAKSGFYYFLEVNPTGQFGMVSHPCNYFLECIVAKKLITYEQKKQKQI